MDDRMACRSVGALLGILLLLCFAAPAGAEKTKAYMPCGTAPHYPFQSFEFDPGNLKWHQRPQKCTYSTDGTEAGTIRLADLDWKKWGGPKAVARGSAVDNHDQDENGFQHRPIKVILGKLLPAFPLNGHSHRGSPARYYTTMTVIRLETNARFVIELYRRNQPVTLSAPVGG